jgi:hypothetical protein
MDAKDNVLTTGIDRLNALTAWWGIPAAGNGAVDRQMKRFQQFASDLQKTCADAYSGEMNALFSSNDHLGRSFQELLQCRRPQDVMAAESEILATLLEGATLQTRRWAELTQKLQECCAAMVREAAVDLRQQAKEAPAPAKANGGDEQQPARSTRRQSAQA